MDTDQNSYAGFVDGEHWATLIGCFEEWAERHQQPHAVLTARRMAETADDVSNDLVMAMFEIVEEEYEEYDDELLCAGETPVWSTFHSMCEPFASGYQPNDASEFVQDLVARLTVCGDRP
jgi:hypothetical protein